MTGERSRTNDPFWRDGGTLRWLLSPTALKKLKAFQPTVKLNVLAKTRRAGAARDTDKSLGFVLLDLRRLELSLSDSVSAFREWKSLNGNNPGRLLVRAQMNALALPQPHPTERHTPAAVQSSETGAGDAALAWDGATVPAIASTARAERSTVLPDADGRIIIGPEHDAAFIMEIEVSSVGNLLPSMSRRTGQFWLSFKFLGQVAQSEVFSDTARPRFPPLQASFPLRSTLQHLQDFLDSQPPLQVFLCSPGVAWCVADLQLSKLLTEEDVHGPSFVSATLAGGFALRPLHPPELAVSYARSGQPEPGVLHGRAVLRLESDEPASPPMAPTMEMRAPPTPQRGTQDRPQEEASPQPAAGSHDSADPPSPRRAAPSQTPPPVPAARGPNVVVIPPQPVPVTHFPTHTGTFMTATGCSQLSTLPAQSQGLPAPTPLLATPAGSTATGDTPSDLGIDILQLALALPPNVDGLIRQDAGAAVEARALHCTAAPGLLDLWEGDEPKSSSQVWVEVSIGSRVASLTEPLVAEWQEDGSAFRIRHGMPDSEAGAASGVAGTGPAPLSCWFPWSVVHEDGGDTLVVRILTVPDGARAEATSDTPHAHVLAEGTAGVRDMLGGMPLDMRMYAPGHLDALEVGGLQLADVQPLGWLALTALDRHAAASSPEWSPAETTEGEADVAAEATVTETAVRSDVEADEAEREATAQRSAAASEYGGMAQASPRTATNSDGSTASMSQAQSTSRPRRRGTASSTGTGVKRRKRKNVYAGDLRRRHFRLSVELRGVKGLTQPANVYATAPFTGFAFATGAEDDDDGAGVLVAATGTGTLESGRPVVPSSTAAAPVIRTHPPTRTAPHSEVLLTNGFRYFEFGATGAALTHTLQQGGEGAEPGTLPVTVLHRDTKRYTDDVRLGVAAVPMGSVLSAPCYFRCPFTHRTFSSRAGYDKHITGLKAAQEPGAPGARLGLAGGRRKAGRGGIKWDTPPIMLRTVDKFFPLLAWGGDVHEQQQGAGPDGDSEAWGAAGRTGGAPVGAPGDRVHVAGHVRVRVYLEDFGDIGDGPLRGASVAGVGTSAGAPPGALMHGSGGPTPQQGKGMAAAVEHLLGWEAGAPPVGGIALHDTRQPADATAGGSTSPFGAYMDAVSFYALPRSLQALALRTLQRWREEAEEAWIADLKEKERAARAEWQASFDARDADRAAEVAALAKQYRALEAQLKRAITKAERQALQTEAAAAASAAQLDADRRELAERGARMADEFKAKAAAEKGKRDVLQERINALQDEVARERENAQRVMREFQEYRAAQVDTPEAVLRDRISALEGERVALTREVQSEKAAAKDARASAATLRAQMYRLARELQRSREKERAAAEADLEKLRVEYLAREERYVLADERQQLRSIHDRLAQLRRAEANLSSGEDAHGAQVARDSDAAGAHAREVAALPDTGISSSLPVSQVPDSDSALDASAASAASFASDLPSPSPATPVPSPHPASVHSHTD